MEEKKKTSKATSKRKLTKEKEVPADTKSNKAVETNNTAVDIEKQSEIIIRDSETGIEEVVSYDHTPWYADIMIWLGCNLNNLSVWIVNKALKYTK